MSKPEKYIEYYPNGQKKSEGILRYDEKGIPVRDGKWTYWVSLGQKDKEVTYKDGKEDGLWTSWWYSSNGQKRYEVTYKEGKEDGLATEWWENGNKYSEKTYKDGKEDGLATSWHEYGEKYREQNYSVGELISDKMWDEDGNECECGYYVSRGCK